MLTIIPSKFLGFLRNGTLAENPSLDIESFDPVAAWRNGMVKARAEHKEDKINKTKYMIVVDLTELN